LNPLQELLQPEGMPRVRGVLAGIERLVRESPVPIIVKEVGAGISGAVAATLIGVGVRCIDVAGAGGTSWAGVEILRRASDDAAQEFWDVGIPTADCLTLVRPHIERVGGTMIASGGITGGRDMAISIALGAHLCGSARPLLQAVMSDGVDGVITTVRTWERDLRRWMFLSGCATIDMLRFAPLNMITT
jgi:isopentenyl-diphosphate delta-isomerase